MTKWYEAFAPRLWRAGCHHGHAITRSGFLSRASWLDCGEAAFGDDTWSRRRRLGGVISLWVVPLRILEDLRELSVAVDLVDMLAIFCIRVIEDLKVLITITHAY